MRVVVGLSLVLLAAAAWVVPLPLAVAQPGRLVASRSQVTVEVSQQYADDAALRLADVAGEYFAIRQQAGPSAAQVIAAAASRDTDVVAGTPPADDNLERPELVAAVIGLGLSPARLQGASLPLEVTVDEQVDAAATGVALFAFDATSALDVARGRRVLGLGAMAADQRLRCTSAVGPSVRAAQREAIDVLVVPADCAGELDGVETAGNLTVVVAESLVEAVDALLAR